MIFSFSSFFFVYRGFIYYSLQSLNISWTSLESEHIAEFSNHVNENLSRLNIAGCRKTLTDDGKLTFIFKHCNFHINF